MEPTHLLSRRIALFVAVYEQGTTHGAAERMRISQPAVTVSLSKLEEDVGAPLFERSSRGMVATEAGDILYRCARNLLEDARYGLDQLASAAAGAGTIRIGAGVGWNTTVVPDVLTALHETFPNLAIELISGVGDQLAARLTAGELDVFLAAGAVTPLDGAEFEREFLTSMPMVAMADAGSRLAQKPRVTPADLAATQWVGFYEDESIAHLGNHFLTSRGLPPPRFVMRTNSPAALMSFVRGTEFVTMLIGPLARAAVGAGLAELNLSTRLWKLPVGLYHRKAAGALAPVVAFKSLVRQRIATGAQRAA